MKKILYHAISAYQLFEVMVHRMRYHGKDYAELLLPDFIEIKYKNWKYIEDWGIFQKVRLLEYMKIPHDENTVVKNIEEKYCKTGILPIDDFDEIYVAGVHFYFAIYLDSQSKYFSAFEDAPGMVNELYRLENSLTRAYPIHAKIAKEHKMLDMSSYLIKKIISINKKKKVAGKKNQYFNVLEEVNWINKKSKQLLWGFYHLSKWREFVSDHVIILTQCFSDLGIMTQEEQQILYQSIVKILNSEQIYIKKHPDDKVDYDKIIPSARYLPSEVPIEILACRFKGVPKYILTISSTSNRLLSKKYKFVCMTDFISDYSYENEFESARKAIDNWRKCMERTQKK